MRALFLFFLNDLRTIFLRRKIKIKSNEFNFKIQNSKPMSSERNIVVMLNHERALADKRLFDYILSQHNIEIRNESVYNALMVCCGKSAPGSIPSTFDIASEVMTQKRCDCFNGIEPGSTIRAAEHTLLHN